jgi:hypothetical protein
MTISCLPIPNSTLSAEPVRTFPLDSTRYRNYHPTLGRWIERDPAGYADGMSLYEDVMSSPAGSVDWSGLIQYQMSPRDGWVNGLPPAQGKAVLPDKLPDIGRHRFRIVGDLEHPVEPLTRDLTNTMSQMCPCLEFNPDTNGDIAISVKQEFRPATGDSWPTRGFCCCYYQHLPACNLFLRFGANGPAGKWAKSERQAATRDGTRYYVIPTTFGAQWQPGDPLRIRGSAHTIAEELVHGLYGTENEFVANAGAALVANTPINLANSSQKWDVVDAMDRILVDLVKDHVGCKNRADFTNPQGDIAAAVNAAAGFRSRVKTMRQSRRGHPGDKPGAASPELAAPSLGPGILDDRGATLFMQFRRSGAAMGESCGISS